MPYQYATESQDTGDYASGAVFYGAPGHPAFPVRLTSEIFQRAQGLRTPAGAQRPQPCTLYDPVCGAAYHLATLAYLHWGGLDRIIASDVDEEILSVARRNLGLLTAGGLDRRIAEIERMLADYGKPSHAAALASAVRLRRRLHDHLANGEIATSVFRADATDAAAVAAGLNGTQVDMVIADVPYGQHSTWQTADPAAPPPRDPLWHMLEALRPVLAPDAVVAIASSKDQTPAHEAYRRADRFQIGKRRIVLLQPH